MATIKRRTKKRKPFKTNVDQSAIQKGIIKTYAKRENGKNANGRPDSYTEEIGIFICEQLIKGKALTSIVRDNEKVPSIATVYRWLNKDDDKYQEAFLKFYTAAREQQAETFSHQCIEIADDGINDTYLKYNKKTGETEVLIDHDVLKRSELRIKTRQWVAAHLLPKKYGNNKLELTGPNGQALIPTKLIIDFGNDKEDNETNN
jgi:hypothetical protein